MTEVGLVKLSAECGISLLCSAHLCQNVDIQCIAGAANKVHASAIFSFCLYLRVWRLYFTTFDEER